MAIIQLCTVKDFEQAKGLVSHAVARLALGLPFDFIDRDNRVLVGIEADFPGCPWATAQVEEAIKIGAASLVPGDITKADGVVTLMSACEDDAWDLAYSLCVLPRPELNEDILVEPDTWFESMRSVAYSIAFTYEDKIEEIALALLCRNTMSRQECSTLLFGP